MKHSSAEFAAIAEQGTILRVQVGSGLHGTGACLTFRWGELIVRGAQRVQRSWARVD